LYFEEYRSGALLRVDYPVMAHLHRGKTAVFLALCPLIETTKSCAESFIALPIRSESLHGTGVKSTSVPEGDVS